MSGGAPWRAHAPHAPQQQARRPLCAAAAPRTATATLAAAARARSFAAPALLADAGTDLWKWDFSDSCNEGEEFLYEVPNRADNLAYHMQLCGIADHKCAPGSPYTTGTVLQTYDAQGGSACQVLGQGAPIFSAWPMDANNVPTGLNITFRGAPPIVGE